MVCFLLFMEGTDHFTGLSANKNAVKITRNHKLSILSHISLLAYGFTSQPLYMPSHRSTIPTPASPSIAEGAEFCRVHYAATVVTTFEWPLLCS